MNWKSGVDYRFIKESEKNNYPEHYRVDFYDMQFAEFPTDEEPETLRTIFFVVYKKLSDTQIEELVTQFLSVELSSIAQSVKARSILFISPNKEEGQI